MFQFVFRLGQHASLDWLMHYLGGLSITIFFYQTLSISQKYTGKLNQFVHNLLSFSLGCTVAVFWEFAEYTILKTYGYKIQTSLDETMLDLIYGVSGAITTIVLIIIFRISKSYVT